MTSQPSSVSRGEPQLPIWSSSHERLGRCSSVTSAQCRTSVDVARWRFSRSRRDSITYLPLDPPREQRHALVLRGGPVERRDAERREVVGLDQLRHDLEAVEGRVGRVVRRLAVVVGEPDEAGVLHAVRLVRARGEDHPLGERGVGRERRDVARRGEHADDLDRLVGDRVRRALALERAQSSDRARRA